jgi:hypothetical protein
MARSAGGVSGGCAGEAVGVAVGAYQGGIVLELVGTADAGGAVESGPVEGVAGEAVSRGYRTPLASNVAGRANQPILEVPLEADALEI